MCKVRFLLEVTELLLLVWKKLIFIPIVGFNLTSE